MGNSDKVAKGLKFFFFEMYVYIAMQNRFWNDASTTTKTLCFDVFMVRTHAFVIRHISALYIDRFIMPPTWPHDEPLLSLFCRPCQELRNLAYNVVDRSSRPNSGDIPARMAFISNSKWPVVIAGIIKRKKVYLKARLLCAINKINNKVKKVAATICNVVGIPRTEYLLPSVSIYREIICACEPTMMKTISKSSSSSISVTAVRWKNGA
uniref:Uncharacterized protein n=1 Tax=Trichogramma kaykai TaxID=54128 RepID=A0ABD2W923_9HYME